MFRSGLTPRGRSITTKTYGIDYSKPQELAHRVTKAVFEKMNVVMIYSRSNTLYLVPSVPLWALDNINLT